MDAAASIGIHVTRAKLVVTLVSAVMTAIGGVLYAQVGAFGVEENALALERRLHEAGIREVVLLKVKAAGRPLWRVRVGPIASVEQYDAIVEQLERVGIREVSLANAYPENLRTDQARWERYRCRWLANDPSSFAAINRMLLDMNIEGELGNIKAPTLLIGCRHDVLRAPALVRTYADKIPDVRYVEADSAHFMHAQTPDLFTRLAVPFLLGK